MHVLHEIPFDANYHFTLITVLHELPFYPNYHFTQIYRFTQITVFHVSIAAYTTEVRLLPSEPSVVSKRRRRRLDRLKGRRTVALRSDVGTEAEGRGMSASGWFSESRIHIGL